MVSGDRSAALACIASSPPYSAIAAATSAATDASSAMSNVTEIDAPTGVAHLGRDRVGVRARQVADDHRRALGAEPAGRRGTDARTAARHHHDLVGQTPHACAPPRQVPGPAAP